MQHYQEALKNRQIQQHSQDYQQEKTVTNMPKKPEQGQEMLPTEKVKQTKVHSEERSEVSSRDNSIMKHQLSKIIQDALEHKPTVLM